MMKLFIPQAIKLDKLMQKKIHTKAAFTTSFASFLLLWHPKTREIDENIFHTPLKFLLPLLFTSFPSSAAAGNIDAGTLRRLCLFLMSRSCISVVDSFDIPNMNKNHLAFVVVDR